MMTTTTIKLTLASCLLLLLPMSIFAAPPAAGIYICGEGKVTLKYSGDYTLKPGDKVVWQKVTYNPDGLTFNSAPGYVTQIKTYTSTTSDTDLVITGNSAADMLTTAGDHYWVAHVIGIDPIECTGDVSDPTNVYMLPPFTLTLSPTGTTYCGNASPVILNALAETVAAASLPNDIQFEYDWVGTTPGAGAVSSTDPKSFVMSATQANDYTVTSNVKYKSSSGLLIKSTNGDACQANDTKIIKVVPAPAKPTITVS